MNRFQIRTKGKEKHTPNGKKYQKQGNPWKMTLNVRNQRQPKKMTGNEMK